MSNPITGLNYIEIGGERRPIKFGLYQSKILADLYGCSLGKCREILSRISNTMENMDGTEIPNTVMSALIAGHHTAKLEGEPNFKFADVCDWIDAMDQQELNRFYLIMTIQNSPNENGVKTPPPKKSPQKIAI